MMPTPETLKLIRDHNARIDEIMATHKAVLGETMAERIGLLSTAQTMHALGHMVAGACTARPDMAEYFNTIWCGNFQRLEGMLGEYLARGLTDDQRAELDKNSERVSDMAAETFDKLTQAAVAQTPPAEEK